MPVQRPVLSRVALLLALASSSALQAGVIAPPPDHYWVGPGCQFDEIQDAIDAADSTNGDVIHLVGTGVAQEHTGVAARIVGKVIEISGGHPACNDYSVVGRTVLSNQPRRGMHGSAPITVTGHVDVAIANVELVHGGLDDLSQVGGGLQFEGSGRVVLRNVNVRDNEADSGGGIAVVADGAAAELVLANGVGVYDNYAHGNGGGIYLEGNARLRVTAGDVSIRTNHAGQSGGGIAVHDGARAVIRSGGPVIEANAATRGGGISVLGAGSEGGSQLFVFPIDARRPVLLFDNRAWVAGGALFAGPAIVLDGQQGPSTCTTGTRFVGNTAPDGAAVFAHGESAPAAIGTAAAAVVSIGTPTGLGCAGTTLASLGAPQCRQGVRCNSIDDNVAEPAPPERASTAKGTGDGDSVVAAVNGGMVMLWNTEVRDNIATGATLLSDFGMVSGVGCLLAGNEAAQGLLQLRASGYMEFIHCTVAGNAVGAALAQVGGLLSFGRSIVDAGGVPIVQAQAGAFVEAQHVLASDLARFDAMEAAMVGRATFVGAARGNYRLTRNSAGIDMAPADLPPDWVPDLDGLPRNHDAPRADGAGVADLGAYEWTPDFQPGRVFADGLEGL